MTSAKRRLLLSSEEFQAILDVAKALTTPRCPKCGSEGEERTGPAPDLYGREEIVTQLVCPICLEAVTHPTTLLKEIETHFGGRYG